MSVASSEMNMGIVELSAKCDKCAVERPSLRSGARTVRPSTEAIPGSSLAVSLGARYALIVWRLDLYC